MAKTNLAKNFTLEEMIASPTAKRLGIDNTPDNEQLDNLKRLATVLQVIRDEFGHAIVVNSGLRVARLNKAVNGASNSDHLYGAAADIQSVGDKYNKQLWKTILRLVDEKKIELRQIIDEYNLSWIHISINNKHNISKNNQIVYIK